MSYKTEPIAIIGSACRFPGGCDSPSKLWELLKNPHDISKKIPTSRFDIDSFYHPEATHHGTTNANKSYFLEEDISHFDATFFNIQPMESDAIDPQQRLLLETVYDSICAAGLPMEKLKGSSTAVYAGMMCDDWSTNVTRDVEALPTYIATGLARSVVSNRISYFFDWHGPSMTIDTACSSSLVAVHQAVQTLRSGESSVAVATGTNLILGPTMFVTESNLRMLSPNGRCAMWDVGADGYARGEGVAAVVLKTLSQALADGDPIECIIRETGVNQDGRTTGLTMPSHIAQSALIRDTYLRAGLDINNPLDRPQFFHAHGTGTQAGDPQESEAISTALFPSGSPDGKKLYVGSIKTVIGHTEGTAGLASLIGTLLAMKNGTVPPNLHFNQLSAKVAPFYGHLQIPTVAIPWPELAPGQVRRASVNSFGFGGTNAHAILESYEKETEMIVKVKTNNIFTPLTFSAGSDKALQKMLSMHLGYLRTNPTININDLSWTLQTRRSTLPFRKVIVGRTIKALSEQLDAQIEDSSKITDASTRFSNVANPSILGVFTGQGAQWPRMGACLVESSVYAEDRIAHLDSVLENLPVEDRPNWSIKEQLLAGTESSRITEAAVSQPLCLAVQVVLVDILHAAGIQFKAVVGHSSGEIGAAYAAGLLSADDAVRIAYYRGLHAKLASSPQGFSGAMMAVGVSHGEAIEFCQNAKLKGRIQIAAVNSASSITLSGDEDAIDEALEILKGEQKFARKLKVDTAYHSAHMLPCAGPYLESMKTWGVEKHDGTGPIWFSSVIEGTKMSKDLLTENYWVDNMCNTVLLSSALTHAVSECGPFDLVIEVGPHPALKGPVTATVEELGTETPYTGLLFRNKHDVDELSTALGFIWTHLGSGSVDIDSIQRLLVGIEGPRSVLTDLPTYPFDHQRSYGNGSRVTNYFKSRLNPRNPLLGSPCSEATTSREFQWRNILRPSEIPWLTGHKLQGQVVFPATGYVSMAVEAMKTLAAKSEISCFKINGLEIGRAIAFNDEESSVEVVFSVTSVETTNEIISADFACYSILATDGSATLNAKGQATAQLGGSTPDVLPIYQSDPFNLVEVDKSEFYKNLKKIGYGYSHPFQGVSQIKRKPEYSTGLIEDQSDSEWEDNLVFHPGMLDTALQTAFAAWAFPGDGHIWSLHVPTHISSLILNPYFSPLGLGKQRTLKYESFVTTESSSSVTADIHIYTEDGSKSFVQIEGASLVPFSRASAADDKPLFSNFQYKIASPNGELAAMGRKISSFEAQLHKDLERAAYWYIKDAVRRIMPDERKHVLSHFKLFLRWCERMIETVTKGEHLSVPSDCNNDTREDVFNILSKYRGRKDIRSVEAVGDNLVKVILEGTSLLDYINPEDLALSSYEDGLALGHHNRWLSQIMAQIAHRYPQMHILEIGAGTGTSTKSLLSHIGSSFSTYTFTDISSDLFPEAEERFKEYSNRMIFKSLNTENLPSEQGFVEGQYDVVVAANVLHTSADLERSMSNVRRLLKPGGYLITLEIISNDVLSNSMTVGTLPEWWRAAESGRPWGPCLNLRQWDSILQKTGYSGIDTVTPDTNTSFPISVFVSQAVDDRVTLLRDPLSSSLADEDMGNLAIIGGTTLPVYELAEDISTILSDKFTNVFTFETLEELTASDFALTPGISVLSLADLDEPFTKKFTAQKFNSLKTLFNFAGTLIWVSQRCREEEPFSYMMVGIGRTVKNENPNINLQLFDIESLQSPTAGILSRATIRHHLLRSWNLGNGLLWSAEPEVVMQDGHELIPRLLPNEEKNQRYNSQRRTIFKSVNPQEEALRLVNYGESFEVNEVSPICLASIPTTESLTIRTTHSLLQSLNVGTSGFLRLSYGVDVSTAEHVISLSNCTESPSVIPSKWCVRLDENSIKNQSPSSLLVWVAANIVAERIVSMVPKGGVLLVSEPDRVISSVLKNKASEKDIKAVFTTTQQHVDNDDQIYIHPNLSQHIVKQLLPSSVAVFVQFSKGSASGAVQNLILKHLPPQCVRIEERSLFSNELNIFHEAENEDISLIIHRALEISTSHVIDIEPASIPLEDVSSHTAFGEPLTVVQWTAESVAVKVQPVGSENIFRSDRTYFFVGLAGELGQSLCQWMVVRGARYFVLSSRTPKVDPKFIESMANQGATVRIIALDITSRKSLRACYTEISRTMPIIAGVMNGAMILQDSIFDNMSHEQFVKVIRPKVEGTKLLDELFYDTPLDFFVVTSSITAVIGLGGQSNYSAANTFMTSLMCQRKKRGVAGSAMDLPAVYGVGYAAQGNNFDFDYFNSIGYNNVSEQDFCIMFAEAVLSGRPESPEDAEIIAGVNYVSSGLEVRQGHTRDVKFCHYALNEEKGSSSGSKNSTANVKTQLQSAKTEEQAYDIIRDAFVFNFKKINQIPEEESVDLSMSLIEQGLDSLVAVTFRSWFLKEIDVDVPVLKILGGSSIIDLIDLVIEKVPASIIDFSLPEKREPAVPKVSSSPTSPEKPLLPRTISESSKTSSVFTSESTPPPTPSETDASSLRSTTPDETNLSKQRGPTEEELEKFRRDTIISSSDIRSEEMSFGQSRFWFLHQFLEDKTPFNFSASACLRGPLRVQALEMALNTVIQRHEALRTRFVWSEGDTGTPMQGVISTPLLKLETEQISSEAEVEEKLESLQNHVFDLENWGAVRVKLLTLSKSVHYFLIACHHIALDGQSLHVFFSDLDKSYNGTILTPLPATSQYCAFGAQQRYEYKSGLMKKEIDFFRNIIKKDPGSIELFPFSKVLKRKTLDQYKVHRAAARLEPKSALKVKQLARKLRCTSFHVYLTVLQALIFRLLPDTDEFFVGIADSNRMDKKFIDTLGCLVNLLPIKFERTESSKLSDATKATRTKVYAALEHSKVPIDVLLNDIGINRSGAYTPIFQIFMDYRLSDHEKTTLAGCDAELTWNNASTGYDMQLEILDTAAGESLIVMKLQDSLYSQRHTELLLRTFVNVLEQLTQSSTSETLLTSPSIWSKKDIDHALQVGKGPTLENEWPSTISHRVDNIINTYPDNIALKDGHGNILTYAHMDDRIKAISNTLLEAGVSDETVVAVFQEPSADWICSLLAIFRTGATYVPLDLKNGIDRLIGSVRVAHPRIILSDRWTEDQVSSLQAENASIICVSEIQGKRTYPEVHNRAKAKSTAVILFTSGSTGVPKGIMLPHSCLVTHGEGVERAWGVGSNVVLQQITMSFDFSLHQIFTALANGGTLCVVPSEKRGDPEEITKLMLTEGVTHTLATPTEYGMWFHSGSENLSKCSSWKWALVGGEALPKSIIRGFHDMDLSGLKLFDFYGPAEATIAITKGEVRYNEIDLEHPVATGYMLPNYTVYILDKNLRPVPVGVPGEIVTGGPGISAGYLGLEKMTAEKFIRNPFYDEHARAHGWNRLYRTGDRGRLGEDGALFYEGRIDGDTQVKLRGIRTELGEIESAITKAANGRITQTVVSVRGEADTQFLVAYVVFSSQQDMENGQKFLSSLRSALPIASYMQPSFFVILDNMPMNSHGKTDRKALISIPLTNSTNEGSVEPILETEMERRLSELWKTIVYSQDSVFHADTDFFHVGGNSLLLVELQCLLKEKFHCSLRLIDLMNSSSLRDMAKAIESATSDRTINWESETAVPESWFLTSNEAKKTTKENLNIVLAGATGYLGHNLLPRLIGDSRVSKILCLVRDKTKLRIKSDKITFISCDLSEPQLGLSQSQFIALSEEADLIIHCAANRSFWDYYEALRPVNFNSVKELARMALSRRTPLHYFSSGAVSVYKETAPPIDGDDGYVAAKWAAETFLRKVAQQLNLPICIHIPNGAPANTPFTLDPVIIGEFVDCAVRVGARPILEGSGGHMDLLLTTKFVDKVCGAVFDDVPATPDEEIPSLTNVSYNSITRFGIDHSEATMNAVEAWASLPTMDILLWMGEVKKNGFPYVLTSHNITMSSGSKQVVTRR